MHITKLHHLLLRGIALLACVCSSNASPIYVTLLPSGNVGITVDENCNGFINGVTSGSLHCGFQADPGPGGVKSAMTYDLVNPPGLVAGDVFLLDVGVGSDLLRFNPNEVGPGGGTGSLVFYSTNFPTADSPADGPPPSLGYTNVIFLNETFIFPGIMGAVYTPTSGQPGFVSGSNLSVTYTFISDVPEPGTLCMAGAALIGLAAVARARRAKK